MFWFSLASLLHQTVQYVTSSSPETFHQLLAWPSLRVACLPMPCAYGDASAYQTWAWMTWWLVDWLLLDCQYWKMLYGHWKSPHQRTDYQLWMKQTENKNNATSCFGENSWQKFHPHIQGMHRSVNWIMFQLRTAKEPIGLDNTSRFMCSKHVRSMNNLHIDHTYPLGLSLQILSA